VIQYFTTFTLFKSHRRGFCNCHLWDEHYRTHLQMRSEAEELARFTQLISGVLLSLAIWSPCHLVIVFWLPFDTWVWGTQNWALYLRYCNLVFLPLAEDRMEFHYYDDWIKRTLYFLIWCFTFEMIWIKNKGSLVFGAHLSTSRSIFDCYSSVGQWMSVAPRILQCIGQSPTTKNCSTQNISVEGEKRYFSLMPGLGVW
jgi:hypothetical protein